MSHQIGLALSLLLLAGCTDSPAEPVDPCGTSAFPLRGAASGPTIVDVGLEVQTGGIVLVATATDPQGTSNLIGVLQSASVFPDTRCVGVPLQMQDDLAGSGLEETFGTVVDATTNRPLYLAIAAATRWPVAVDFRDKDGNRTTGRVMARIERP